MDSNDFVKARHTVTGKVSDVPYTYFDLYPGTFKKMSDAEIKKHRLEVEDEKTIYADDAAPSKKAKPSAPKAGK